MFLFNALSQINCFINKSYQLGFRDNYLELIEDGFKVQIPTCSQLEKLSLNGTQNKNDEVKMKKTSKKEKSLTTAQTGATRLVTKVRIELIKNFFKLHK